MSLLHLKFSVCYCFSLTLVWYMYLIRHFGLTRAFCGARCTTTFRKTHCVETVSLKVWSEGLIKSDNAPTWTLTIIVSLQTKISFLLTFSVKNTVGTRFMDVKRSQTRNMNNIPGLVWSILYHLSETKEDGQLSTHVSTEITVSTSPKQSSTNLTQTRIETNSSLLLSTSETGLNTLNIFYSIVCYKCFVWLSC